MLAVFGFVGYALRGIGFPVAPLILAMVIGPMLETSLRQSLSITGGNLSDMIFRPICLTMYSMVGISFILPAVWRFFNKSPSPGRSQMQGNRPEK
jgi:putative tricarboxylic transport membrane protein